MSCASDRWLLLLALLGCERPTVAHAPEGPIPLPSTAAATQSASARPPDAGRATEAPVPTPPSTDEAPVSVAPSPGVDRWRQLLERALGSEIERAWAAPDGLFLLTRTGGRAIDYQDVVPVAAGAREAAIGGRVVAVADVWRVVAGKLERVWRKPIGLRPMVCELDDCDIVALDLRVTKDAILEIGGGTCAQATAALGARPRPATTFDRFDRAALAAMCGGQGRFRWNGRSFSSVAPSAGRRSGSVSFDDELGSGPPAALPSAPASLPTPAAAFVSPEDAAAMARDHFFDGAIWCNPEAVWLAPGADALFGLFALRYPAAHSAYAPHTKQAALWASGRAIAVAEVWAASPGQLRRVLRLPVGFSGLGEPLPVLTIAVEAVGDDVQVGDPAATCAPEPSLAPPDAHGRALDEALGRRFCASRGRYRYDGRSFVRVADRTR